MINGVWKYNQGEGIVLDSFVDGDRRLYRIYLGNHIASCPLPDHEFEITDERVPSSELNIDVVTRPQVADGRRLYDVEFDEYLVVTHLPNPRNFELFEPGH